MSNSSNQPIETVSMNPLFILWFKENFPGEIYTLNEPTGDDSAFVSFDFPVGDAEISVVIMDYYYENPGFSVLFNGISINEEEGKSEYLDSMRQVLPKQYEDIWRTSFQQKLLSNMPHIDVNKKERGQTQGKHILIRLGIDTKKLADDLLRLKS